MRRIRITGLVRQSNHFRHALSGPMTAAQRDILASRLASTLHQVDAILSVNHRRPEHLPPQSRRAYEFLRGIDLSRIPVVAEASPESGKQPESVSFPGLRAFLDRILDDIASNLHAGRFNADATQQVIARTRGRLDHAMAREHLQAGHLRPQVRELLGWFRYFSDPESLGTYVDGVRRAQAQFGAGGIERVNWRLPLLVHFRPSHHLYRWQVLADGTRIVLNTPALLFDDVILRRLGQQMCGHRAHRTALTDAMMTDDYQSLLVELEAAAGIVERTRGMAWDLAEVFDRVNGKYFESSMPRPKLCWNRTLTGYKFGHYDFIRDTVMISSSLDRAEVPVFVVDHVMHHELLHKKHRFRWQGSRRHVHTPEFRAEEHRFEQYEQADQFLRSLSRAIRH